MKAIAVLLLLVIGVVIASPFCSPLDLIRRTLDGQCNNVLNKKLGSTNNFFKTGLEGREAYPESHEYPVSTTYSDLSVLPDEGVRGNPRYISNMLAMRHDNDLISEHGSSMMSTMFGQFITHDLDNNRMEHAHVLGVNELPIYVLDTDDYTCLETPLRPIPHPFRCGPDEPVLTSSVKRSSGEYDSEGAFRAINNATSFLDLDHVYGRTKEISNKLRLKTGGKLLYRDSKTFTVTGPGYEYTTTLENLPPTYQMAQVPVDPLFPFLGDPDMFFVAGDERINENMALMLFHIVFLREHNRICDEIMDSNLMFKLLPSIFDDEIFRRARDMTIAKYQHIVYEQFIPSSYGTPFSDKVGEYTGYKFTADPTTSSVFADIALRYGHFTPRLYPALDQCGIAYNQNQPAIDQDFKQLYIGFLNPSPINMTPLGRISEAGGLDNIARGLISETIAPVDFILDNTLKNFTGPTGVFDIAAIDIQRARFNSIPNYQKLRSVYYDSDDQTLDNIYGSPGCPSSLQYDDETVDPIECFLMVTTDEVRAAFLQEHYRKLYNIDAIVGAMMEESVEGSAFGPTVGNIIADQFKRTRDGDRFFYRSLIDSGYFSSQQSSEILSTTMGGLLRRNIGDNSSVSFPDNPFKVPENYRDNLRQQCA